MEHKDQFGNPISAYPPSPDTFLVVDKPQWSPIFFHITNSTCVETADPDWSNPTRPRFERPLDTIRSFEAAIYGTYASTRPASYIRTGSFASFVPPRRDPSSDQLPADDAASQMGDYSRRTSYYGGMKE
jgi:hypothetical protein